MAILTGQKAGKGLPNWQGIGQIIAEARVHRGLSKAELARRSGISLPFLSRLERGTRGVSRLDVLERLATALELDAKESIRLYLRAANLPSELCHILYREEVVELLAGLLGLEGRPTFEAAMVQVRALATLLAAAAART
jgi:transcriptional regulator with XRE-family HTH domain